MNIIPIKKNSKIPAIKWLKYREEKFPVEDLPLYEGMNKAVICGKTSDNLVIIDFDFEGQPYFKNILNRLKNFPSHKVKTPHGLHIYYLVEGECPERQTQIKCKLGEVKHFDILGEGGYALIPPSMIGDEFYLEIPPYRKPRKISREVFDKIVEIFQQKNKEDESVYDLTNKLGKLRKPIQQLIKGEIDIEDISAQTKNKEFLYWKALFLETRTNGIPDDIVMGILSKSQKHFDAKTTTTQLRQIKAWERPYTNLTLKNMFNITPPPPDDKLEEGWVSIARDLIDTHNIITMKDTEQLMVQRGNIYSYDISGAIHELSDQLIDTYKGKSYEHKRKAVIRLIKDTTFFDRKDFCYDRWVINFENGYYDIKKNKFIKSEDNIDKIFCYEIPHEYHSKEADCPKFKKLLIEWLEEDNIVKPDDIFEMIGYTMTMTTHLKMAFMIYGKSNTGKTAFQNILSNLIGIDNISQNSLERLGSNEFGTDNLEYKILNMCGDMGEGMIRDVSVFKNLTGGDIWVKAEYKGGKKFSFRNMLKIWYNLNHIPTIISTHDMAFFNRWTLINFAHEFPMGSEETIKEIWTMINDNPEEIQGIIHEAIKGVNRLLDRNEFFRPELIENTRHIWEYESDPLYAFMWNNCIEKESESISCSEFKMAFNKYLYGQRRARLTAYKLNDMLETKGIFKERDTTNERGYYYSGVGWKPEPNKIQKIIG